MFIKFTLAAIPVTAAAVVLWIVVGGAYVALAPENIAGEENIGIILSVFGFCLFLADRYAWVKMGSSSWIIIMKTWLWGLLFLGWGLVEWALVLHSGTAPWFALHTAALIACVALVFRWQARNPRTEEDAPASAASTGESTQP